MLGIKGHGLKTPREVKANLAPDQAAAKTPWSPKVAPGKSVLDGVFRWANVNQVQHRERVDSNGH